MTNSDATARNQRYELVLPPAELLSRLGDGRWVAGRGIVEGGEDGVFDTEGERRQPLDMDAVEMAFELKDPGYVSNHLGAKIDSDQRVSSEALKVLRTALKKQVEDPRK